MDLSKPDLKIELSPSQLLRANEWLHIFYSKCKSRMSDPVVENGFLKISSADIYNFLSSIETNGENKFDWVRLRKSVKSSVQQLLSQKKDVLIRVYYQNQLELLGKFS